MYNYARCVPISRYCKVRYSCNTNAHIFPLFISVSWDGEVVAEPWFQSSEDSGR